MLALRPPGVLTQPSRNPQAHPRFAAPACVCQYSGMASPSPHPGSALYRWRFGEVEFDEARRELRVAGLPVDAEGFIRVTERLTVEGHDDIFAAGDVIAFAPRPLPKAGVYAVRAGPVLAENLWRASDGRPLRPFRPQHSILALLSTGDGEAIASKGPFALQARWLFTLKDWIDRRWMAKYQPPFALPQDRSDGALHR